MTMAGLFDKIKKRSGLKGKSDADVAEAEMSKPKKETQVKKKKVESERADVPKINRAVKNLHTAAYRILLRPVVSEKATIMESFNKYIFRVSPSATKTEVKEAVQKVYGVKPTKVKMINMLGKSTRVRSGSAKRGDWKKALVTLPTGQTINIHEGV